MESLQEDELFSLSKPLLLRLVAPFVTLLAHVEVWRCPMPRTGRQT